MCRVPRYRDLAALPLVQRDFEGGSPVSVVVVVAQGAARLSQDGGRVAVLCHCGGSIFEGGCRPKIGRSNLRSEISTKIMILTQAHVEQVQCMLHVTSTAIRHA